MALKSCIFLADGNSIWARAFYAASTDPEADPVEIAQWLTFNLLDYRNDRLKVKFSKTLFAWDKGQKKDKQRAPRPESYETGREIFKESLSRLIGTANCSVDGCEADDVICTAVEALTAKSSEDYVYIISSDKDLQQLVSGNVSYYCLNTKAVLSRMNILNRWKVKRPSQIALALAIMGDSGDCIKGVRGWGPKKVESLFENIREDMNFEQAMNYLESQMNQKQAQEFFESLELTLLQPNIPGVPEPNLVKTVSASEAREWASGKGLNAYLRLRAVIANEDADEDDVIAAIRGEDWEP